MADGTGDGRIFQFGPVGGSTQEQSAAAHVSTSDEIQGEFQSVAEHCQKQIDILFRSNAPEEDNVSTMAEAGGEFAGVALKRKAISRVGVIDVNR
jgi:hypothetical protein